MIDQILAGGMLILLIGSLVFTNWPPVKIFGCTLLACYFFGLVETDEILEKTSNPGVMTLLILLLVSMGLEKLNWIRDISGKLISKSYVLSLVKMCGLTAVASAFVNNTAVVATLAQSVRNNKYHLPSKLLIPLSYAAILGGTTTLIGTSTNLIVASFLEDATGQSLAFFDFLIVGVSVTLVSFVAMLIFSRLLPSHPVDPMDMESYFIETEVQPESPMIGRSVSENKLRELESLFLVEIVRGNHLISPIDPQERLESGDRLIFSGDINQLDELRSFEGLTSYAVDERLLRQNLTEVIVMPNATIEGKTIKDSGFRARFDAAVVGLHRGGKRLSGKLGEITLQAGDNLMLATGPDFESRQNLNKNFTTVSDGVRARISTIENYFLTGSVTLVIVLASLGILPLLKGLLFVLAGVLLLGTVRGSELRRRFPFELMIIVISALVFAQALQNTGLAGIISDSLYQQLSLLGPTAAIAGVFLATLLMTEVMTNNAAAALGFPIAFGLAESFGLNYMPFVMAVAYGASASFLSPYGYTTNLMVQNLGNYSFSDYVRIGLPVSLVYSSVAIFLIPRVFPF